MKHVALAIALACFVMSAPAAAEEAQSFSKDQIATGAELYAVNCSPCHGARMQDPGAAFNLRKFPQIECRPGILHARAVTRRAVDRVELGAGRDLVLGEALRLFGGGRCAHNKTCQR